MFRFISRRVQVVARRTLTTPKSQLTPIPFLGSSIVASSCKFGATRGLHATNRSYEKPEKAKKKYQKRRRQKRASILGSLFTLSKEVQTATGQGLPIVGLETTIYTHGFPYPENVKLALDLEQIVRENGGVPATIGVLDGQIRVGMTTDELTTLASSAGKPETMKVSRRDIPYIVGMGIAGRGINGGTTVAGTMKICDLVGIKVFGTGGLGGVHRDGENTMDVSADLTELGRTNVAVISSGCKSFLDLPRTLEFLETQGVMVSTFADGRPGEVDMPSFYSRESGIQSPTTVQTAKEAAAIIFVSRRLTKSGLLFANPIPETHSIPKEDIDAAINQAVQEAADQGFHGHRNTPFILARIKELTQGNSIPANRALIESNVRMATKVAVELAKLESEHTEPRQSKNSLSPEVQNHNVEHAQDGKVVESGVPENKIIDKCDANERARQGQVIVFGSVAIDLSCDHLPQEPHNGVVSDSTQVTLSGYIPNTSNVAAITQSIGGVGHNVALAAQYVRNNLFVKLHSFIGDDAAGMIVRQNLEHEGLWTDGITIKLGQRTAQYVALNSASKELVVAAADMDIIKNAAFSSTRVWEATESARWVVVDANWHPNQLQFLLHDLQANRKNSLYKYGTAYEPVSVPKAGRIFAKSTSRKQIQSFPNHAINLATPNQYELAAMHSAAKSNGFFESKEWWETIDALGIPSSGARDRFVQITNRKMTDEGIPLQTIQLLPFMPTILTKLGSEGVLVTAMLKPDDFRLTNPDYAPYILSRNMNGSKAIGGVYMRLFPAEKKVGDVVSVNGVGDTFLGAVVMGFAQGISEHKVLINLAQRAAVLTLMNEQSVSPEVKELAHLFEMNYAFGRRFEEREQKEIHLDPYGRELGVKPVNMNELMGWM